MSPQHREPPPPAEVRDEYLAKLQLLAASCRELDDRGEDARPEPMPDQLILLAEALERLEGEMSDIRDAQRAAGGATAALERRMAALEQSTPTPQTWRDLIQGIRNIRELVAAQAQAQQRGGALK